MDEQRIAIAHKLYESRRTLRRLLGDEYADKVRNWMHGVVVVEREMGQGHLRAAMTMLQAPSCDGMTMLWIMAAAVELIEPDEQTPPLTAAG